MECVWRRWSRYLFLSSRRWDHRCGHRFLLHRNPSGKVCALRIPYPMGFYAKGIDGRIDDPNGGWKGKGIWTTYATRTPFHAEGGKGTTSKIIKVQVRPDALAK